MPRRPTRTHRCPDDHAHGANSHCYAKHGCGCASCKAANASRIARHRVLSAAGLTEKTVPADTAREHVNNIRAAGVAVHAIASRAGVGLSVVSHVSTGRRRRITPTTEAALLGVTVEKTPPPPPGKHIDSTGTHRRLQALVREGWTLEYLSGRLNATRSYASSMLTRAKITVGLADKVDALYRELIAQTPPDGYGNRRAVARAVRSGWHGPDAWIDVDIDDPGAAPDTSTAPDEPGWAVAELAHLHALGESPTVALAAIGRNRDALSAQARRHDRPDLAVWINQAA